MEKASYKGFYTTPPLWTKRQFGIQQFDFPEVDITAVKPPGTQANLRLGHQMEVVFSELIHASRDYSLVFSNLLIDEGKTRLGELDFILRETQSEKLIHVELAYKFYIINPEISEPIYRLMGPNRRDMFYTKLDKLKEKQFPLLFHKNLAPYWETSNVDPIEIEQHCCFKAQLFAPYGTTASIRPLNTECILGSWISFEAFNTAEFRSFHYYIPRKLEWVIAPHEDVPWANHFETLMEVNLRMVKENAPMLWMKSVEGTLSKMFVVWW